MSKNGFQVKNNDFSFKINLCFKKVWIYFTNVTTMYLQLVDLYFFTNRPATFSDKIIEKNN